MDIPAHIGQSESQEVGVKSRQANTDNAIWHFTTGHYYLPKFASWTPCDISKVLPPEAASSKRR